MLKTELLEPDGIVMVTPEGPLAKQDFRAVAAIVDPYIEKHGHLNGLLIHAGRFPGWRDFASLVSHIRFVRDHHKKIDRVAAVSDNRFLEVAPKIAAHFVSADVRHFPESDIDAALAWLRKS